MRLHVKHALKAERLIQTLLREWACAYRYPNSDTRTAELKPWMQHYNPASWRPSRYVIEENRVG